MSKLFPIFSILIFIIASYFLKIYPQPSASYLQQTEQCFLDGQIPCRWTQSPDYPYGHFIFAHQGGLIYYLSLIFRLFGFDYQVSILMTLLFSSLSLIYFGYRLFKPHQTSITAFTMALIISVISYLLSTTLPILGLVLLLLIKKYNLYLSSLALASIIFTTPTNNLSLIAPILFLLLLPQIFKDPKRYLPVIILSILLSSFYLGPSFIEKNYSNLISTIKDQITNPITVSGDASISQYKTRSNFWRFTVTVNQNNPATIVIPIYYYPNWIILIDQQLTLPQNSTIMELTKISIPPGNHTVVAFLQDSKLNTIFNLISLMTFTYIFIVLFPKNVGKSS